MNGFSINDTHTYNDDNISNVKLKQTEYISYYAQHIVCILIYMFKNLLQLDYAKFYVTKDC